ncbi:MAG: hypothetical protein O3C57_08585, partial [Verrucomicrobia bacterium]|nr:hypothetical protein [Verrucomicrobiota bacterium]
MIAMLAMLAMLDLAAWGDSSILVLFAVLMGLTLLSEDLTCIGAGLLVVQGYMSFGTATAACVIGILAGDLILYAIGRTLGRPVLEHAPFKWFVKY